MDKNDESDVSPIALVWFQQKTQDSHTKMSSQSKPSIAKAADSIAATYRKLTKGILYQWLQFDDL